MQLPNAERASVDMRKLRNYCLNAEHPRGQHKARVFKSAVGWTADQADYGQRYALDFAVQGVGGAVTVRSLWIVRHGEDFPRFASCYVLY